MLGLFHRRTIMPSLRAILKAKCVIRAREQENYIIDVMHQCHEVGALLLLSNDSFDAKLDKRTIERIAFLRRCLPVCESIMREELAEFAYDEEA
jgi:hypothetical protein